MKKLFQQIDDLCVGASIAGICSALNIRCIPGETPGTLHVMLPNWTAYRHTMPDTTDRLWRRKWRKFLTDHVDDVANNLDAGPAAARDGQSGSGV